MTQTPDAAEGRGRRPPLLLVLLLGLAVVGFTALGIWQIERRALKLALIDRVESRVHADPAAAPGPDAWPSISAAKDEYRRIRLAGRFLDDRETLVQAVTEAGTGFWVMTPIETDLGFTVLVNRGFVPSDRRAAAERPRARPDAETSVTGLLRISEPHGGFLRANDPSADRWYSRDVDAIAAARGLKGVAPYFVDADATSNPSGLPIGGLTVVRFSNNHLVYAATWFGLALIALAGLVHAFREPRR